MCWIFSPKKRYRKTKKKLLSCNDGRSQSGAGKKRRKEKSLNKKIKGGLKNIAKVGRMASLAAAVTGNPEAALPLRAVSEAFDVVGSGHEEHDDFSETIKKIGAIPKKKKNVPRYTLATTKKNFND